MTDSLLPCREAFEKWCKEARGWNTYQYDDKGYLCDQPREAWITWQAAWKASGKRPKKQKNKDDSWKMTREMCS